MTFVSSRERERDACDVIDITLKSRVIMHMITSTARWPYAYAYASTRSEPAPAVECSNCMTSQNHKQQLLRPRSGSSKIQKHIPEQPGWRNSKYWGNIEKRNQINTKKLLEIEKEIVREVVRGDKHNLRKSANCKAQISRMCGVNDTDLCVADLQIFSGCVCPLEQLHAQSPFLFPIVFSINITYNDS